MAELKSPSFTSCSMCSSQREVSWRKENEGSVCPFLCPASPHSTKPEIPSLPAPQGRELSTCGPCRIAAWSKLLAQGPERVPKKLSSFRIKKITSPDLCLHLHHSTDFTRKCNHSFLLKYHWPFRVRLKYLNYMLIFIPSSPLHFLRGIIS